MKQKAVIKVSGDVQGVGFRFTARALSKRFEVNGWVRNNRDGTVSIEAEGTAAELDRFLQAIKTSRLGPGITRWEEIRGPATGMDAGFEVAYGG